MQRAAHILGEQRGGVRLRLQGLEWRHVRAHCEEHEGLVARQASEGLVLRLEVDRLARATCVDAAHRAIGTIPIGHGR